MSRPTVPPEEFLRRENIMGVRKGVSAARWTHLTPSSKCPDLLDTTRFARPLFEEIRLVDVHELGAREHPDDAADGEEDAERHGLLARGRALARDHADPDDGARQEGRQERGDDRHAEVEPHGA